MIYSVRGEVVHKEANLAVIECGGVGYGCRTTDNTLSQLKTGEEAKLLTYMHFSQDNAELFGFFDKSELYCFKLLLTVSGVGPKAALSVLSGLDTNSFALIVATGDHKRLQKIKGVGPKMAQRIVLELKDKLAKGDMPQTGSTLSSVPSAAAPSGTAGEALAALMVLGFSEAEAENALSGLDSSLPIEQLIKAALKKLG